MIKELKNSFVPVIFMMSLMLLLFSVNAAAEKNETVTRWMGGFYLDLPANALPLMERDELLYILGIGPMGIPQDISVEELKKMARGGVGLGHEPPPRGHAEAGYRGFYKDFQEMLPEMSTDEPEFETSYITLAGEEAFLVKAMFTMQENAPDGTFDSHQTWAVAVNKIPDAEGNYRMLFLMANDHLLNQHPGLIESILKSADADSPPPLELDSYFTYKEIGEREFNDFQPVMLPGRYAALVDRSRYVVRIYDHGGEVQHEWSFEEEATRDNLAVRRIDARAESDGHLLILIGRNNENPDELLRFSPAGELDDSFSLDLSVSGKDERLYARYIISSNQKGLLMGAESRSGDANGPFLVKFSRDMQVQTKLNMDGTYPFAIFPDGSIFAVYEDDAEGFFVNLDHEGRRMEAWGLYGSGTPPVYVDEFNMPDFEHLEVDNAGNIYAQERYSIWIYDRSGRLLQVVPTSNQAGNRNEMAVGPEGHVMLVNTGRRPGPMTSGPAVFMYKNIEPAEVRAIEMPAPAPQEPEEVESSETVMGDDTAEEVEVQEGFSRELLALVSQEGLTVRAFRAFEDVPPGFNSLAMHLMGQGKDLLGADIDQLEKWINSADSLRMSAEHQKTLKKLHEQMNKVMQAAGVS